jgi:hypothetical protein
MQVIFDPYSLVQQEIKISVGKGFPQLLACSAEWNEHEGGSTKAPDGEFLVRMARGCRSDCGESMQNGFRGTARSPPGPMLYLSSFQRRCCAKAVKIPVVDTFSEEFQASGVVEGNKRTVPWRRVLIIGSLGFTKQLAWLLVRPIASLGFRVHKAR